jgi:hypothetical protein
MRKYCPSCGCWALIICGDSTVHICDECNQVWTDLGLENATKFMNLNKKKEIDICKYRYGQAVPGYVSFGHRHLEKECPEGRSDNGKVHFIIPVDLLAITLPKEVTDGIESVEMVYEKK